jgi:hypothetical protein
LTEPGHEAISEVRSVDGPGIPWHVSLHARLIRPFSKARWRMVWVRYWESQGISEEEQMEWAAMETAREEREKGQAG